MEIRDISPEVGRLVADVPLPRMFRARQKFPGGGIESSKIYDEVRTRLKDSKSAENIQPGMQIAITVGSRGITNLVQITRAIVDFVKQKGANPFLVPAMGSHGGATAEGQAEILAGYGITEDTMGCPVRSSMEVVNIGKNQEGVDVYIDKNAWEADGIILNCRIKPHTSFRGTYESGMMKMMAIGLGKQYGAEKCHEAGFENMAKNVYLFGKAILEKANILMAVAVIENAYEETAKVLVVAPEDIEEKEPEYLQEAFGNMPKILVDSCDVLVVDRIGKNYSGDGMDPNITGTFCTPYATGGIKAQKVAVLDLSEETHGNAMGIGMASATTRRVFEKMDLSAMYPNAITAGVLLGVRIPMVMQNDREAIQVCVKSCSRYPGWVPRIVRISNTLQMEHIWLSENYWDIAGEIPGLSIESDPEELHFDESGNLI